ncbi:MAG: flagellar biosynthesis protein FlhG [Candidatus Magnetoglobus multicellularis str. Araruama]|uniref:Flagellar biosynthesis protein FlhG n=1 Tax=Candidatus Magnetoglobus multicellularis str. Araruama TaxID=890399 RepID=A0A1V1P8N2_9BACT|nr:MAG: flagellar biosynthesis protein FlhG [Candidatus Magnetoglobus multicellularis str. Araruama]
MKKDRIIIPIASGKGGVGKSIVSSNLAIAIAQQGHKTVAVDLDLGGSNLHTYLGLSNKYAGIGDYLKAKNIKFKDMIVETEIPNLSFVPGEGRTPFLANIPFEQRLDVIQNIQQISAEYILLDLGAGTTFNTLNFFGISHQGIIVTTFETPAVMNFFMFLKNFLFRIISSIVRHDRQIFKLVVESFRSINADEPLTVKSLLELINEKNPELAARAKKTVSYYHPRIIFNMGDHPDDLLMTNKIDRTLQQTLSLEVDYFGFILYDNQIRQAIRNKEPLMQSIPKSPFTICIQDIARRIIKIWDKDINKSGERLYESTKKRYKQLKYL